MKSLNIKIPLTIVKSLDDSARLNPSYMTSFIVTHFSKISSVVDKPIIELSYNYTFKVHADLHQALKIKSVELGVPMNELIGRLLSNYYKGDNHEQVQAN